MDGCVMGFYVQNIDEIRKSTIDGGKPYSVWKSPAWEWWCVLDKNGYNVLSGKEGEKFTDEKTATAVRDRWMNE